MATQSPETQKRVKSVLKTLQSKADKRTAAKAAAKANMTPAERKMKKKVERSSPQKREAGSRRALRKMASQNPAAKVAKAPRVVEGLKTGGQQRVSLKAKPPATKMAAKTAKAPVKAAAKAPVKAAAKAPVKAAAKATPKTGAAKAGQKAAQAQAGVKRVARKAATSTAGAASKAAAGGAKVAGAATGAAKGAGKVLGKVAAPIAAAAGAIEAGKLLASKEARDNASANFEAMGEKNTFGRAVESALDPVNTIYGAGAALANIASNDPVAHQRTLDAAVDPEQRAASAEKGAKRDAIMAEAFSPEEFQKLNRDLLATDSEKWNKLMNAKTVEEARSYGGDGGIPDEASFIDRVEARVDTPASEPTIQDEVTPVQDTSGLVPTDKAGALDPAPDPEVEPLSEESSAVSLFSTVHGGPFDPNSSMDRAKLAKIQSLLNENGGALSGMTPNEFALKIYRQG